MVSERIRHNRIHKKAMQENNESTQNEETPQTTPETVETETNENSQANIEENKAETVEPAVIPEEPVTTFDDSGLKPEILKSLAEIGFKSPMPIQEKVIEAMLQTESDMIGLAQTGTGKTAAFGLPLVHLCDPSNKTTQAIVLTPTRELCIQVANDIEKFGKYVKGLRCIPVYGGSSIDTQIRALKKGVQIIVGTPGRTHDLIRRKKIDISSIRSLVLDEADEMLSMGFREELNAILAETPEERQTLLFSATMPREIAQMADKYMDDPVEIAVGTRNSGTENVKHHFYLVSARDRYLALKRLADINPDIYSIVFCRTRQETKDVADMLIKDGYNADSLHGDLSQAQRDQVMNRFRNKSLQMLVATDVAARGLDVTELTHVINYNLPDELETYIHRSGRTGRAGNTGVSIAIIHTREQYKIKTLERKIKQPFERKMVPTGSEICEKQLFSLIDKMEKVEVDERIEQYLPAISKKLEWLSREELIKHFVSVEFNRFLDYYKNAADLNIVVKERKRNGDRPERKRRGRGGDFARFFINTGSQQGVKPQNLIGMINDATEVRSIEIGKIEILKNFSFFEVDSEFAGLIMNSFKNTKVRGRKVVVELAQAKENDRRRSSGYRGGENKRGGKKRSRR